MPGSGDLIFVLMLQNRSTTGGDHPQRYDKTCANALRVSSMSLFQKRQSMDDVLTVDGKFTRDTLLPMLSYRGYSHWRLFLLRKWIPVFVLPDW
jgi:hypothetical protein